MIPASNNLLLASADEGYNLTRSLRFRSSASAYLSRTPASAGNQQIWTYSTSIKRGSLGIYGTLLNARNDNANQAGILFWNDDTLVFSYTTGGTEYRLTTTQVFRDPSASYYIIFAVDTTQATAANRVKLYVNGTQVTAITGSYPPQNSNVFVNSTYGHNIGRNTNGGNPLDGYLAESVLVDGQQLTPSSFGSTNTLTGVWQPARYVGTYGTNGFYLPFTDNSALTTSSNAGLGKDFSGNGNYWTTNNISITSGTTYDSMTDVPTLTSATAANFCVWNAADPSLMAGGSRTISNGNLTVSDASTSYGLAARGTFWQSSGKLYWEINCTSIGDVYGNLGFCDTSNNGVFYQSSGQRNPAAVNTGTTSYGASYTTGDVIGVALDLNANSVTFYKNNVSQGAVSFSAGTYTPAVGDGSNGSSYTWDANFGQRPFAYTPPTGYVALNTYNLPTSTIVKGNTVMDATLWTGNNTSRSIANAAPFKPDLVWIKSRSNAEWNILFDSVRGTGKSIYSNSTNAEVTNAGSGYVSAFNSDGFSVVGGSTDSANVNATGYTYVGWQWQAGQGTTSSNTSGTITSTVSVNASAGFSVAAYIGNATAGATVGHGLGVVPALVIAKGRGGATSWPVYHKSLGASNWLSLNGSNGAAANTQEWGGVAPTSSVITIGNSSANNNQAYANIIYAFSEISGFSQFGKYNGNSSADGVFIYTGFRPKLVWLKCYDGTADWYFEDSSRSLYNVASEVLSPNLANAETSGTYLIDFLSNGFKLRTASGNVNSTANNYVYACWAENPFRNALAR